MRRIIALIHLALVWLILAAELLQFYFAGMGLFGAASFQLHRVVGNGLASATLLLLVLALAGWLGRRLIGLSALLLALTFVQGTLPFLRDDLPWVAALHPMNALALLAVTFMIARAGRARAAARDRTAPRQRAATVAE